ncbi:von Willebrand factor C domain-containing protein 2-like [Mactra antiquata]
MRMRIKHLSLVFAIWLTLCVYSVTCISRTNELVRKFIHGCPFAVPCPPPPCIDPVFGPGNCCGTCPDEPETTSTISPSATTPALNALFRLRKSKEGFQDFKRRIPFTTTTYPTTSECPYPCTHHGYQYCHPLPCYINCVDAVKQPGGCCYECINGPNCSYEGTVIPENTNITLADGKVVYCSIGGLHGGSVVVHNVLG